MPDSLSQDSPAHSSSSDDFASFLETDLAACPSESDNDGESDDENKRVKRQKKVQVLDGDDEEVFEQIEEVVASTTEVCAHPGSFVNMCILCGKKLDKEDSSVSFAYVHKELRFHSEEIARLRDADTRSLLTRRKLYLILDLDHTLLNSTLLFHLNPEEEYLKCHADSLQDIANGSLFMLEHMRMMTKLRPYVRQFLKEASEIFEMYIYTMGDRPYAREMANLLDPRKEYFNDRVISRDDGTLKHQKGLDVVLGQESAVLILDDTENAWMKHKDNVIVMERYHFFASSCQQFGFSCKSLSELKTDESETDGALAAVLGVLKRVHSLFFDMLGGGPSSKDAREVLKMIRKEILQGCTIVFSHVFPTSFPAESHQLWKMAEQLGATCLVEVASSITHVVAADPNTEKSRWAVKEKKFLVHPRWIEAAYYLWKRSPEENYPVNQVKPQKRSSSP